MSRSLWRICCRAVRSRASISVKPNSHKEAVTSSWVKPKESEYLFEVDVITVRLFRSEIDEQIVFDQLDHNEYAIWSLLLASGYLKVEAHTFDPDTGREEYALKLTNKEVRLMFQNMIEGWFKLIIDQGL